MMMDPEIRRQFQDFDQRLKGAEKRLLAVGNLVRKAGIPMLFSLTEAQRKTDEQLAELAGTMRALAEAQKRTEESLRRLIERTGDGHGS